MGGETVELLRGNGNLLGEFVVWVTFLSKCSMLKKKTLASLVNVPSQVVGELLELGEAAEVWKVERRKFQTLQENFTWTIDPIQHQREIRSRMESVLVEEERRRTLEIVDELKKTRAEEEEAECVFSA